MRRLNLNNYINNLNTNLKIIISGNRCSGKTTYAKNIFNNLNYIIFDNNNINNIENINNYINKNIIFDQINLNNLQNYNLLQILKFYKNYNINIIIIANNLKFYNFNNNLYNNYNLLIRISQLYNKYTNINNIKYQIY